MKSFKDIAIGFRVPEDLRDSNELLAGNETFHLKKMEVFAVAMIKKKQEQHYAKSRKKGGKRRICNF